MSPKNLNRRDFLKSIGMLTATSVAQPGCTSTSRQASIARKKPRLNILWISCEDISPHLGCYGDDYADTPNLDRLAKQGCRYTNAFVPYPVCAPTRSAVITAMYPSTIGSMHMRTSLKGYQTVPAPYVKCFTEYLRAAGYYCTNKSKTDYQFSPPFTAWDESNNRAHWRNRPKDMPFFSVINLFVTHESQCWDIDEPLTHNPDKAKLPPYYPDTPIVRRNWARYYDRISLMDKQAGNILKQLKDDGLADNTVVFFWSDHGMGLPRGKRWPYDSGLHVPLIVRWPGEVKPSSACHDLINLIDLGPTVLSIAGIEIPSYMQGRAFLGEQKGEPRKYVFGGRERMGHTNDEFIRSVRDKRYRYVRNFMPERPYAQRIPYMEKMPIMQEWRRLNAEGKLKGPQKLFFQGTKPPEELYDIEADPYEVNNLADSPQYKHVLERMRTVLERWMEDTNDLGRIPEDELIERMWPGRKQPLTATPTVEAVPAADGKMTVEIDCATEGASIGYRLGEKGRWLIYTLPIHLKPGTVVRTKAVRIGYLPSRQVRKVIGN